jgi:hypothetical protein
MVPGEISFRVNANERVCGPEVEIVSVELSFIESFEIDLWWDDKEYACDQWDKESFESFGDEL